jgi:hypothetical protein
MRWRVLIFFIFFGCSSDLSDDSIPFVPFQDIVINLNLPEYNTLKTTGHQYINSGGVKGIIIHQVNSGLYYAFERNCSYQPNNVCSTVEIHSSNLYMTDPCCGSTFSFDGTVTGGVAWRPLRRYETILSGSQLTITDTILQ